MIFPQENSLLYYELGQTISCPCPISLFPDSGTGTGTKLLTQVHKLLSFVPMDKAIDCYVGMGGNFANTLEIMHEAATRLKNEPEITDFKMSRIYKTSPVRACDASSFTAQPHYLNALCRFHTTLPLKRLWEKLQQLEVSLGKVPKPKNHPRLIDLDLIFYGSLVETTEEWTIPHPRWHERLFVLTPLSDVTDRIPLESGLRLKEILEKFSNPHQEAGCYATD